MLFAKEIDKRNINNKCNQHRNKDRRNGNTPAVSDKQLVDKIIKDHNYYDSYDSFSFFHGGAFKIIK